MKSLTALLILISLSIGVQAQLNGDENNEGSQKLTIKGYAQIDYNQELEKDVRNNGTLDVHRMVLLFGYRFNKNTSFVSEIEYEHVSEVYIEQAYINHKVNNYLNLKAGLLLVPMGIINEYHEPPTFNGVERPNLDKYISPTTWREIGAGITGRFDDLSIKYQAYVMNGFKSYDGAGLLSGKNGLRKGRQKGAESFISYPSFTGRIDYYGVSGLKVGASSYVGKTQSSMYDGLDKTDAGAVASADSSVVGVTMFGADVRYNLKGLNLRGQYYLVSISNTEQYNGLTGSDLGSELNGFYVEAGYDVFSSFDMETELIPFIRYENYNTHAKTTSETAKLPSLNKTEITAGLGLKLAHGAMLKGDIQFKTNEDSDEYSQQVNLGVAIWF